MAPGVRSELASKRARASGTAVRGVSADASRLDMFKDREFEVVFACAALHHTLKYPGAVEELARVMAPGARLVLCETWGGNPILNGARKVRALIAGEQEEQREGPRAHEAAAGAHREGERGDRGEDEGEPPARRRDREDRGEGQRAKD